MNKTLLITSIAPPIDGSKNINNEKRKWLDLCISSWISSGHDILSINTRSEIEILKLIYPTIQFEQSFRTTHNLNQRNLVYISDALSYGKVRNYQRIALCNGDVLITEKITSLESELNSNVIFYSHRINIDSTNSTSGEIFTGIDYINGSKKMINSLPETYFTFGLPWWDYWYPYYFHFIGCKIVQLSNKNNNPILLHKKHNDAWNYKELCIMGTHFFDLISKDGLINIRHNGLNELYSSFFEKGLNDKGLFYINMAQSVCAFIIKSSDTIEL